MTIRFRPAWAGAKDRTSCVSLGSNSELNPGHLGCSRIIAKDRASLRLQVAPGSSPEQPDSDRRCRASRVRCADVPRPEQESIFLTGLEVDPTAEESQRFAAAALESEIALA